MNWIKTGFPLAFGVLAVLSHLSHDRVLAQDVQFPELQAVAIRFIDSATGYAVQPESVSSTARQAGAKEQWAAPSQFGASGQGTLLLERGSHTVAVMAPNYAPMSAQIDVSDRGNSPICFLLDPLVSPAELHPVHIASLHRANATVIVGFVVDDESGQPLSEARVSSMPSGVETRTDARGFFQIHVPLQSDDEAIDAPANLSVEKTGYVTEERRYLELWPNGDWTFRIRLAPGEGRSVVEERRLPRRRKQALPTVPFKEVSGAPTSMATGAWTPQAPPASALGWSNLTIRVPRTIRVLLTNGTVEYVSMELYCRRSLPREWIASWNNFTGGSNSLKAGAVAVRTYAIGYVNNPRGSDHDICATTACQVYGSTTSTSTDNAVNQTAGYVMVDSNVSIPRGLTEYSSENNSLGFSCGDGFTQPASAPCIADAVCLGETRFGHGRGMCQWGSAKWATGLKFPGNDFPLDGTTTNGYARQDWVWIVGHYYPDLMLVQGSPLVTGDDIKVIGSSSRDVRMCADGSISNGVNCPLITTKSPGATGVVIGGPVQVTSDGFGYTWWKIQWNDAGPTIGWSAENWLERVIPIPEAPTGLAANAMSASQVNLTWIDNSMIESGFKVERGPGMAGPWTQIATVTTNVSAYSDTNLSPSTAYYYRVRAYNLGGDSANSAVASVTTPGLPPELAAIADRVVTEGSLLTFTNTATAPEVVQVISDFESFADGTANGTVLFRQPTFSGSTSAKLDPAPDVSSVTGTFPAGNTSTRALRANWSFTNGANPWLRLTTHQATSIPSPVVDFTRKLRFRMRTDRSLNVAVGLRETTNAPGTPIGSNGGTLGGIEWAGVTGVASSVPIATRTVAAGSWVTLTFDLPQEPIANFAGGNGILSTASGLGTLEHLAFVPAAGIGAYDVYLDDFAVVQSKVLTYSLDVGAPAGASVNPTNGVFTWTPEEAQGPGVYPITVRVTDNSLPPQSDGKTFMVTVNESNRPPVLASIPNRTIHAGCTFLFTNSATDPDLPVNSVIFNLDPGAPMGANVDAGTGVFSWTPTDAQAGGANNMTVRTTDNGSPPLDDAKTFSISVAPRPAIQSVALTGGSVTLTWNAIPGETYCVEYKDELSSPWTGNIIGCVVASGATATIEDPDAMNHPQRFYRIQHGAQPP